jgi:ABC-type molybdenum transport system ATPase subunit/photorepair protein PhrA
MISIDCFPVGLDPPTMVSLSPILRELAQKSSPRLVMSLRPQDPIPDWITHLAILGHGCTLALAGPKDEVVFAVHRWHNAQDGQKGGTATRMAAIMTEGYGQPPVDIGHTLSIGGVVPYMTYSKLVSSENPAYIRPTGEMEPKYLDPAGEKLWRSAAAKPRERMGLTDLLALTCLLPADFRQVDDIQSFAERMTSINAVQRRGAAKSLINIPLNHALMDPLIELRHVVVSYGEKTVLGHGIQPGFNAPGLNFTVRRGTRLALLGPNGSGKTTFLSLLTSDHPQSYSLPIRYFGRSRLPSPGQPGLSLWEVQSRIGHSSPEIHAFFPRDLTIRKSLESAWADTFLAKPNITEESTRLVDAFLKWWEPEINPHYRSPPTMRVGLTPIDDWVSTSYPPFKHSTQRTNELNWALSPSDSFGTLSFQTQRLILFLRAIIKGPDIVILDEAFSGLSSEVREKAMLFLEAGEDRIRRRRQIAAGHPSGDTEQEIATVKSPCEVTENHRAAVDTICRDVGITADELLVGKKRLRHSARSKVYHLRTKIQDELKAMAADKSHSLGYAFRGLKITQALIVVSHAREEIPELVNEYVRLPGEEEVIEQGRSIEMGRCENGSIRTVEGWARIWGLRT